MNNFKRLSYKDIIPYIEKKLISESLHPENPDIRIFNYSQACQFDKIWDDVTLQCRGLIMNIKTDEILALPMPKFFNVAEHIEVYKKELPDEEPMITEKEDGSLGIGVFINDKYWIATRGSFTSDQALWATDWVRKNADWQNFPKDITLLFEIIYAENRIVIQYDFEGLVFLAALDIKTGKQVNYAPTDTGIRKVKKIQNTNILELAKLDEKNKEGFVIFYPKTNLRLKIKFEEYVRLHKILTGLSVKGVWEYLKENGIDSDIKDSIVNVPDEFFDWLTKTSNDLKRQYKEIEKQCQTDFNLISFNMIDKNSRKEWAGLITKTKYPSILFSILDGKNYSQIVWKMIRPKGETTFKKEI